MIVRGRSCASTTELIDASPAPVAGFFFSTLIAPFPPPVRRDGNRPQAVSRTEYAAHPRGVRLGSNPAMHGRLLHGRSTPLGGLNSGDARGRGCVVGLADGLFGARSIWSTSMRFAHWFKSRGRLGRCSFAAGPRFSKLQHRLVRFYLGFASSRIRMRGSEMNLASLANRPTESAFA